MNRKFPFLPARNGRLLAHSALLAGTALPWPALAQLDTGDAQQADGVVHAVAPGDYATDVTGQPVFEAINGGVLTTTGKTRLFSTGNIAAGASARGAGSRIELRDVAIRTRGGSSTGIDIRRGGSVLAERISIDTDADYAHGASVDDADGTLDIADGLIVTRGKEAAGIAVNFAAGSTIGVTDTLVLTSGLFAYGMTISYDGAAATLTRTDIGTAGDYASALYLPGASPVAFADSRLETGGFAALGVDTRASRVDLDRIRVLTHGESAHGLYASKEYAETPVIAAADSFVTTAGARSIGAIARLGGQVSMTHGGIETRGERAYGALSSGTGSRVVLADMAVGTHGDGATGVQASAGGTLELRRTDVRTAGAAAAAGVHDGMLDVDGGSLVSARHGALDTSGGTIALRNGAYAAGGNGVLMSVRAESGTPVMLTLDAGTQAAGDIVNRPPADGSSPPPVAEVALSHASQWAGATRAVRALSLDGDSRWTVTADSTVGSVALNDSAIAFETPDAGAPRTLVVTGDYAARNGKLILHATLHDDASPTDRLVIDGGRASGDTGIVVKRSGGDGAATAVGIPIVETRNGGTTDASAFVLDAASDGYRRGFGTLSAGGYDYMLERGGNGGHAEDWYLVSAAKPQPPVPPDPPIAPEVTPPPRTAAPEPDAYLANADAAAAMAVHTLHQRDDRSLRTDASGSPDGAVWLRAEGQTTSMSGGGRSVSGNGRLIHAGADLLRFGDGLGGTVRIGAMGMYGSQTNWSTRPLWNAIEQRIANATARGSVSGYNVGLYGTWYGNRDILSGPYVDAWFMYGAYANSVGGSLAADSYRSRTVTGSIETGYSLPFYEQGDTRWFVEPEAQFVVTDYRADAHDTAGGRLEGQGATDVLTRLGVRVHGVTAMPRGRELRPFLEANWWHGPGSRSLTLDRNAFSFSVPRDRIALRVGATGQVSRQFSISASLGVEGNLSDYSMVKGQIAAQYRW
ncbi:autotransporter outer membrane beta-barrel domain-containing protein [Burkholderia cepacia]|uniref:autotransporter family protein n=1 Tax=Burkholderia cepacia TaxID=292 RepID=UPI00075873D7|nr:autotransporter outer membrane beta-barrel domain-containing protein [Burkholderia cepacia]KVL61975.1 autotransporter outer membrane beta-barrel domain-containing protein [Burkholderia cepacia]